MSTLIIFLMEEAVEKTNEPGLARSMAEIGRMGVFPVLKKTAFLISCLMMVGMVMMMMMMVMMMIMMVIVMVKMVVVWFT